MTFASIFLSFRNEKFDVDAKQFLWETHLSTNKNHWADNSSSKQKVINFEMKMRTAFKQTTNKQLYLSTSLLYQLWVFQKSLSNWRKEAIFLLTWNCMMKYPFRVNLHAQYYILTLDVTGCVQFNWGQVFRSHITLPSVQVHLSHGLSAESNSAPLERTRPSYKQAGVKSK